MESGEKVASQVVTACDNMTRPGLGELAPLCSTLSSMDMESGVEKFFTPEGYETLITVDPSMTLVPSITPHASSGPKCIINWPWYLGCLGDPIGVGMLSFGRTGSKLKEP